MKLKKTDILIFLLLLVAIVALPFVDFGEPSLRRSNLERRYPISNNVSMMIHEAYISAPLPDFVTITMTNHSNIIYVYRPGLIFEKEIEGTWYRLPDDVSFFADIAFQLWAYSSTEVEVWIDDLHDRLSPGRYRMARTIFERDDNPRRRAELVMAEFMVE